MHKGKQGVYRLVFIILAVVLMLIAEQLLVVGLRIEHPTSLALLLSGSVWAFIANALFDKFVKRKESIRIDTQLQEILKGLQELKEIINR